MKYLGNSLPGSSFFHLKSMTDALFVEAGRALPLGLYLAAEYYQQPLQENLAFGAAIAATYIATGMVVPHLSELADNIARSVD